MEEVLKYLPGRRHRLCKTCSYRKTWGILERVRHFKLAGIMGVETGDEV